MKTQLLNNDEKTQENLEENKKDNVNKENNPLSQTTKSDTLYW